MRKVLLALCFLIAVFVSTNAAKVVFDPATYNPADLPNPDSMAIVNVDGTDYLRIVVKGWNDIIPVDPLTLTQYVTGFQCEVKLAVGATSGYPLADVNTFLKLTAVDGTTEICNSGAASTADFAVRTVAINAATHINDTIGFVQVAGQKNAAPDQWSATYGDTLWLGKITLVEEFPVTWITGAVALETFGDTQYGTGSGDNGKLKTTGDTLTGWKDATYCTWRWDDVTTFTSTNGHIESGSDSSVRFVNYTGGWTPPAEWVDPSLSVHALLTNRGAYAGSWDTLIYKDIDISETVVQSIQFGYGKNPNWTFINADTAAVNVMYRIDGGDWIQADTSLIDPLDAGVWDYIILPVENGNGYTMDVFVEGLNQTQIFIDDLGVYGLVPAPQGTNDFTVENVVFGAVDDAADFTCNLHAAWDADSVYLNFVIADDSIVNISGSGNAYQVDNLEIYFDMDNSKNIHWPRNGGWMANDPTYDANDYQLRLVPDSAFDVNNTLLGVRQVYEATDTGYNIALNICWDSLLVGFVGAEDSVIGFDVLISDNDATASDANRNQITFNSPTDKPFNDPSLFATFVFRPEGRFEIVPDEEAPGVPANYNADCADTVLTITWDNADDNIAVMRYEVLVDGAVAATRYAQQTGNQYVMNNATHGEHSVSVRAIDNYGNTGSGASSYETCAADAIDPIAEGLFRIYPNPASSVLNIDAAEEILNVQVISITGAVTLNVNNVNRIDLSKVNAGIYMIKITTESEVYSTTFVKE